MIIAEDENVAHRFLTEDLLDFIPDSIPSEIPHHIKDIDGIEVNIDSKDVDEQLIW